MPTVNNPDESSLRAPYVNDKYTKTTCMRGYHSGYHACANSRAFSTPVLQEGETEAQFLMGNELELAFSRSAARQEFCDNLSNWYCCESDGSLSGTAPMELITIPLRPEDATDPDFWRPLCKKLSEMGARSWSNNTTGLHVHIGRGIFCKLDASVSAQYRQARAGIGKLSALYALFIEDNPKAHRVFGRKRCYQQIKMKDRTISKFAEVIPDLMVRDPRLYKVLVEAVRESHGRRTCEVNTLPSRTIEFRMGKGSIKAERIAAINEFCLLFCKWTLQVSLKKNCSLENFEEFMRANVRENSWLTYYYFGERTIDEQPEVAPNPRGSEICEDSCDM